MWPNENDIVIESLFIGRREKKRKEEKRNDDGVLNCSTQQNDDVNKGQIHIVNQNKKEKKMHTHHQWCNCITWNLPRIWDHCNGEKVSCIALDNFEIHV